MEFTDHILQAIYGLNDVLLVPAGKEGVFTPRAEGEYLLAHQFSTAGRIADADGPTPWTGSTTSPSTSRCDRRTDPYGPSGSTTTRSSPTS
jgi:hypothetical protein